MEIAHLIEYLHQDSFVILVNNDSNYKMQFPDMELFWKRLVYLISFSIKKALSGNHQGLEIFSQVAVKE